MIQIISHITMIVYIIRQKTAKKIILLRLEVLFALVLSNYLGIKSVKNG